MPAFTPLTDAERDELYRLLASGQLLPEAWRGRLFPDSPRAIEIGKEFQLVYEGKARREEVLAETPAAPWQLVRRFCTERPFEDGWRNLLAWGDNLLALRELLADQRGPDHLGTRGKIKLIYIDPPFATRQDLENLLRLQQAFGPMFRELDAEHPRLSQVAQEVVAVDLQAVPRQAFSESAFKEHGAVYYAADEQPSFDGHEMHLWEQYRRFQRQFDEYGDEASDQAIAIGTRMHQVDLRAFKTPWNVHYASHEPERQFSDLLFANADLFDAFIKMPDRGGYAFPYSYKPAQAARTHVADENFNPDYFIRVRDAYDILVVEIKQDGDDSNRNRAKYRDGTDHFATLHRRLAEAGEPWRYHFCFLSPEDYPHFFDQVRGKAFVGWKSGLMQGLGS